MADTVRTKSELLVIFQDNTTGDITEQDIRDFVVTTFDHSEDTSNPHSVTATQTGALVSVDGVSNAGGDVDLVAGTNITITPDDAANTITITAAGSSPLVVISDPGNGNDIEADATAGVHTYVAIAPLAGTRGLADPTQVGSLLTIACTSNADLGDVTITAASAVDQDGTTVFTLTDVGDYVTFISMQTGISDFAWRYISSSGIDEFELETKETGHAIWASRKYSDFTVLSTPSAVNNDFGIRGAGGGTSPPIELYTGLTTSATEQFYCWIPVLLDGNYVDGENITIRLYAGHGLLPLNVGEQTEVTVSAIKSTGGGSISATPSSLVITDGPSNRDFVLAGTTLVAGELIWVQVAVTNTENDGDGMEFVIRQISTLATCTK